MVTGAEGQPISTLLVDESFAAGEERFVDRVRQMTSAAYLAGLADRWKKDHRPWAREQIFKYLELPLDRVGHHPLVKRLFKQAEANRDDELMAAFMVAFDRLVRRQRRTRYRYDYQTRQSWQEEELSSPRNQILTKHNPRDAKNRRLDRVFGAPPPARLPKDGRLFSYKTRGYLRRRAGRYFRRMGYQRPAEFCAATAKALALYRDEDVARGENILDNWSLLNLAFRKSPVLEFGRTSVSVAEGKSLGELAAAPRFEALWKEPKAARVLLGLLAEAQSRLVRVWTMQLLKRLHAATLQTIAASELAALLDHADQEVQQFAAGLLESLAGIENWPVSMWLSLLETRSVAAVSTICEAMKKHVRPERLSLEQNVALACARATPVARMGFAWLRERRIASPQDRAALRRLSGVECEAIGAEAAAYALAILASPEMYHVEEAIPFFDSLNAMVREGAWAWLTPTSPGYNDPALWSRLLESPYDDVRLKLVEALNQRKQEAKAPAALLRQDVSNVWAMVLLNVHRGGRAKLTALRQISQAIADEPARAERLLPVLAVAIRSVRPPEARAGLSAILSAVETRPELEAMLTKQLPELRLAPLPQGAAP